MQVWIFDSDPDHATTIEVEEQEYRNPNLVEVAGMILARDYLGRLLISFPDMWRVETYGDIEQQIEEPCWIPERIVRVLEYHRHEPSLIRMSRWLYDRRPELTTAQLREEKAKRDALREAERQTERAHKERKQHENQAARALAVRQRERSTKRFDDQGSLF